jgi:hypothetical protein
MATFAERPKKFSARPYDKKARYKTALASSMGREGSKSTSPEERAKPTTAKLVPTGEIE